MTKIRMGIVGAGRVTKVHHLPCYEKLKDRISVVAICDTIEENAKKIAQNNGIKKTYNSTEEMLEEENLDVLDICSPGFTHYKICQKAMESGVNCLIEKPVTVNLEDLEKLIKLEHESGTKNCVIQNYRFIPPVLRLTENLQTGKFGKVKQVTSVHHSMALLSEPEWYRNEKLSGGIIFEAGAHVADLQCLICGPAKKILGISVSRDLKFDIVTGFQTIIEYEEGATGIIDLSSNWSTTFSRLDVFGTALDSHLEFYPYVYWQSDSYFALVNQTVAYMKRVSNFGRKLIFQRKQYYLEYHYPIISRYIDSIAGKTDVPVTLSSVRNTISLLEKIKKTVQSHRE